LPQPFIKLFKSLTFNINFRLLALLHLDFKTFNALALYTQARLATHLEFAFLNQDILDKRALIILKEFELLLK
jgi:hypothetical protein